jgi:hypothetical protein
MSVSIYVKAPQVGLRNSEQHKPTLQSITESLDTSDISLTWECLHQGDFVGWLAIRLPQTERLRDPEAGNHPTVFFIGLGA